MLNRMIIYLQHQYFKREEILIPSQGSRYLPHSPHPDRLVIQNKCNPFNPNFKLPNGTHSIIRRFPSKITIYIKVDQIQIFRGKKGWRGSGKAGGLYPMEQNMITDLWGWIPINLRSWIHTIVNPTISRYLPTTTLMVTYSILNNTNTIRWILIDINIMSSNYIIPQHSLLKYI
jgi:hypothetical protein